MLIDFVHRAAALRYRLHGFDRKSIALPLADIVYFDRPPTDAQTPLLFVHGLGTSSSSWTRVMPHLPRGRRIICIDLPGFGSSTTRPAGQPLSMALLDNALSAFIDAVLPDRLILIGHSLGGWLVMRLAARKPDHLERLVLVNPAGVKYPGAEQQARFFAVKDRSDVLRLMDTMWHRYPWYFRPLAGAVAKELNQRGVRKFVDSITPNDVVNSVLKGINIPVRIIWGINDRLIHESALQILQDSLPQATTHLINRCGHIPQLERPRELAATLADAMEGCDGLDR